MTKARLREFDNAEGFRRVLLARGSGTVDEIAESLGVSRATYYRLVDMFVGRLYGSDKSSHPKHDRPRTPWFQERLIALTEAHPSWGCYKLAASLSADKQISGPTIQKTLARLGLDTREKRFAQMEKILLADKRQFAELGDAERQPLIRNNPCLVDVRLLTNVRPDLEIFAANVLEVEPLAGNQHRYLLVLISLNTHIVHLQGWSSGKLSSTVIGEGRERATTWLVDRETRCPVTHLLMQANSRFSVFQVESSRRPKIIDVPKSQTPATLRMVNKIIIKELIPHYAETLQLGDDAAADDYLRQWADGHNRRPRLGFPTFGKSPMEQHEAIAQ